MSRASEAFVAQGEAVVGAVEGLTDLDRPSVLPGWRVKDLVAHLAVMFESVPRIARNTTADKPGAIASYLAQYAAAAGEIRDRDIAVADEGGVVERLRAAFEVARRTEGRGTVAGSRGAIRWEDYLVTRVLELVVHTDDLDRSAGIDTPLDRTALKITVSTLAKAFAEKAPGRSVELRIPPYAAVQCVEGPRHTRGTPPNVVETDPLTWVRLAAGRLSWAEAVAEAKVRASGQRADLGEWLPLL